MSRRPTVKDYWYLRDMNYQLRLATLDDGPNVETLIQHSARNLNLGDYSPEQIEGALQGAFGLDTQLIRDRTYFVVEVEGKSEDRNLVACGGWSFRKTLFGSDQREQRDPESLDPDCDAAKIRAFFIDPAHARRGLGSLILDHCEMAAVERGFRRAELMATLTGLKLYAARGYQAGEAMEYELGPELSITFVPMTKNL